MRGFSAAMGLVAWAAVAGLSQAVAAGPVSEVTGNWAGPAGGGFDFRAQLEQEGDRAHLTIWNGMGGVPEASPEDGLRVEGFALAAFATEQRLEVLDGPEGSLLLVITEYADEEAEGREVVQVQFLDNQFTVIGYWHRTTYNAFEGGTVMSQCEIDLRAGVVVEDGQTRELPPMDFEATNAADWRFGAAYDRGWCSRTGG